MPAVSFYLNQHVLESVRAKAHETGQPVSKIITDAVNFFIEEESREKAKSNILELIRNKKVSFDIESWEEIHQERNSADADRD